LFKTAGGLVIKDKHGKKTTNSSEKTAEKRGFSNVFLAGPYPKKK